jgi:hypothetical protein
MMRRHFEADVSRACMVKHATPVINYGVVAYYASSTPELTGMADGKGSCAVKFEIDSSELGVGRQRWEDLRTPGRIFELDVVRDGMELRSRIPHNNRPLFPLGAEY